MKKAHVAAVVGLNPWSSAGDVWSDKPIPQHVKERKEMELPEGKTCQDCFYFDRCRFLLGFLVMGSRSCDWHPSRFAEKK